MANERPTLYTGMTNNLVKRAYQHKNELIDGFTKKYHIHKLVYYEIFNTAIEAIYREKQNKDLDKKEKIELIKIKNREFKDLYQDIIN